MSGTEIHEIKDELGYRDMFKELEDSGKIKSLMTKEFKIGTQTHIGLF